MNRIVLISMLAFTLAVMVLDAGYAVCCADTFLYWESNPIALWSCRQWGIGPVIIWRCAWPILLTYLVLFAKMRPFFLWLAVVSTFIPHIYVLYLYISIVI